MTMTMDDTEKSALEIAREEIVALQNKLATFYSQPLVHAIVIDANNDIDPSKFKHDDLVKVITGEHSNRIGRIFSEVENGKVRVVFPDLAHDDFLIGIDDDPKEVQLLGKSDGTSVSVSVDGTPYEIRGVHGKKFHAGQAVKVNYSTKQIVEETGILGSGVVLPVRSIIDEKYVEVELDSKKLVILNGSQGVLEPNDLVQIDRSNMVIVRKMNNDKALEYSCIEEINVDWNDIGGCEAAKEALVDLVELPFAHPEIYKFYNQQIPKGGLLYGPPGNGKTMLGKAAYTSLAKRFGQKSMGSGWIYVKGPELLNMWQGNTESNIRNLFERGEKHYRNTGFPAILFLDEAEAMLGERGNHVGGDFERTVVPQFLSQMDGLESSHVVVLLATNRPDTLDPAVTRHGRIDRHVKVPRPTEEVARRILNIHLQNKPLNALKADELSVKLVDTLFSSKLSLYKLQEKVGNNGTTHYKEHIFCLKDVMSGAMLSGVVQLATNTALKRDLQKGVRQGVQMDDFLAAIESVHAGQVGQNHKNDLEDFLEVNRIDRKNVHISKG